MDTSYLREFWTSKFYYFADGDIKISNTPNTHVFYAPFPPFNNELKWILSGNTEIIAPIK